MWEEEGSHHSGVVLIIFLILVTGHVVVGSTLETDREVLLQLKSFLTEGNKVNQGTYVQWSKQSFSPCDWQEVSCNNGRVTGINLSECNISCEIFGNFSALTEISNLDLSRNSMRGSIPSDLSRCSNLKYLNLSQNLLEGELNLTGLSNLETLDLTNNRLQGEIQANFPAICNRLITLNLSTNNFTGKVDSCFNECWSLQYIDLSSNKFDGELWSSFTRLKEFSVAENRLNGEVNSSYFHQECNLQALDFSKNLFFGKFPGEVAKCKELISLVLWGNNFTGQVPAEIGELSKLQIMLLGNNKFEREIPESLLNCSDLVFLDMSRNKFGEEIQDIFGRFVQVKFLVLHGNSYTGGIYSSGILKLPNISRLDLSYNNFSGPLPVEISEMLSLKFLILAYNNFSGNIPPEYGNLPRLQALDLSYNLLTGVIPSAIGKLNSLLWLMLSNNSLTGEIPPELGNCGSLLWLNLASNRLTGNIPHQLSKIGLNATQTFELNRKNNDVPAGSGECLAMRRWIPANYPPFSFVYDVLTRKSCRSLWDRLLKGYALYSICVGGSSVRTLQISGYVQLSENQLSGEIPKEIGLMQNMSLIHVGMNNLSGELPAEIGQLPLGVLNVSHNSFSGEIPCELGRLKCLQILDLSVNNFSGVFPTSLDNITDLNKFNVSYNPLLSGVVPMTGQLATFDYDSFLGDPLLINGAYKNDTNSSSSSIPKPSERTKNKNSVASFLVFFTLTISFLVCGVLSFVVCFVPRKPQNPPDLLLEQAKCEHVASSSSWSSPITSNSVMVIRLDKTAFTYNDILKATWNFSEKRVIGRGGCGTVYRGGLLDGREVAVKKLQREGADGEREFQAEMEVMSGNGVGWPHPNLVTLYGWCLYGAEKLLVYEYMEGGSLEDLLSDRTRLTWRKRINVAIDVARALMFLHHECYPSIVHRDVKASNVLLDREGKARVTDFGLARVVGAGESHVSTVVAGTIGYVAPEYGLTWQATTKGDVYSYGILAMELATGRRAVDGGEECLLEWARRVIGTGRQGLSRIVPAVILGFGLSEGAEEMCELLKIGLRCTAESPQARPNMKEVLAMLIQVSPNSDKYDNFLPTSPAKTVYNS
ncbi:hypothetical protein GIB67_039347 [Kingdonia uniflora]|uniref:non-specific serine/threonine protein kinase n=1 Tax=Kingdonia uniflora TaxID=39325 RepID=A0A7J7LX89_9MAGN|nr:hypothetical protein GIB67_039347 [Kingdonia uniflora]